MCCGCLYLDHVGLEYLGLDSFVVLSWGCWVCVYPGLGGGRCGVLVVLCLWFVVFSFFCDFLC